MNPTERLILQNQLAIMRVMRDSVGGLVLEKQIRVTLDELKMHESDLPEFPEGFVSG